MSTLVSERCRLKKGLFRCTGEPAGTCQYCGRPFCPDHGVLLDDGQEICSRKPCVAKREDVARHLVYKSAVERHNAQGLCGIGDCDGERAGQCSRCKGFFCRKHVRGREEMYLQNQVRTVRTASLCEHCFARRPIWVKQ